MSYEDQQPLLQNSSDDLSNDSHDNTPTSPRIMLTRPSDVNINHQSEDLLYRDQPRSHEGEIITEETPLLPTKPHTKRSRLRFFTIGFLGTLIFLSVFGYVIYNIANDIQTAIDKSFHLNVNEVSLQQITPVGVDVHIVGVIDINYDQISNTIQRGAIKLFTGIFGALTISNLQPVEMHTRFIDLDSPFIHLVDSLPPPIEVGIGNQANTIIDIVSPCEFVSLNFVEFLNYYYQLDDEIRLEIKGVSKEVNIKSLFISTTVTNVEFHDFITVNKNDIMPDVNIDKFDLKSENGTINIKADASIIMKFLPLNINLPFGFINWNLFFEDCDANLIQVGDWTSSPFVVEPHKPIGLTVNANISSMPDCLMDDCKDNGQSPINKILDKYLQEKPIGFYLQIRDRGILPDWIFNFLHKSPVRLEVKLPKINMNYPLDFVVDSSEVEINNTTARWNSNLSIITNKLPVDFDIEQFKFDFVLSGPEGSEILVGSSNNQFVLLNMTHNHHLNIAAILPNMDVSVTDPTALGKIINELLNTHTVTDDLFVKGNVDELTVNLPFGEKKAKVIEHLSIPSTKIFPMVQDLDISQDLLNNLTIDNVFLIGSSPSNLKLHVDLTMLNPTNITVDLPEAVTIGVSKNNSLINLITIKECRIPKHDFFNVSVEMDLQSLTYHDKSILEYSISSFLSGENLTIAINNNSASSWGLNEVVRQIDVRNLMVYSPPNLHKKFIIDATVHLITSEVELTIFNPIVNSELVVEVYTAFAKTHDDDQISLGHLLRREYGCV
ncbi:hypothetical protein G210_2294 [Candida maltosa Xu316]|uniref:Tag1-like fifth Ig-like domain-containing protein n=1 Tax=Candida maltosa (strain Xu316) TaxID=1245528 RepID=M3ILX2_CANMX|nr:hypothetical protein G210_2294 [Candida maltosa Xu316]